MTHAYIQNDPGRCVTDHKIPQGAFRSSRTEQRMDQREQGGIYGKRAGGKQNTPPPLFHFLARLNENSVSSGFVVVDFAPLVLKVKCITCGRMQFPWEPNPNRKWGIKATNWPPQPVLSQAPPICSGSGLNLSTGSSRELSSDQHEPKSRRDFCSFLPCILDAGGCRCELRRLTARKSSGRRRSASCRQDDGQ